MKKILAIVLALFAVEPGLAQGVRPEAVKGAVMGGVAGAIIGHNSGDLRHSGWRGAAIGAGTGFVVGSIIGNRHDRKGSYHGHRRSYHKHHAYGYRSPHRYHRHGGFRAYAGYGLGRRPYGYYSSRPGYVYLDRNVYGYGYDRYPTYRDGWYGRPSYAANGALIGALAGAVIGNNSGDLRHSSWRGAGYGALAGYVIGSLAENNVRRREADSSSETFANVAPQQPAPRVEPATPAVSGAVTAQDRRPSSSMSSANSLFGR